MKRWGLLLSAILLSSLLIAACGEEPQTTLSPAGHVAAREADLFWFILIIATMIFVFVEGWLILTIVRYRARPNSPEPKQIHGNNLAEIIWTAAPSLFLFLVLGGTIYEMFQLQQPPGDKLEVRVVGHQWWWEFDYLKYPSSSTSTGYIVTADTLYVPNNTIVQLDLTSNNVIHSFWIPALTGKTDVIPGHTNTMWFKADPGKTGIFRGACAEYCGTQHAHMNFVVQIFDQGGFNAWVSTQQGAAQTPTDPLAAKGKSIFTGAGGCQGCHGIVGVNLTSMNDPKGAALVGPNLTHFGSRRSIAGDTLEWDPASCQIGSDGKLVNKDACNLYKWLHDPQGVKPGSDMVIGQLSDDQITALIAYLESLK
jgi:cytochrome c oxidase subunit 2